MSSQTGEEVELHEGMLFDWARVGITGEKRVCIGCRREFVGDHVEHQVCGLPPRISGGAFPKQGNPYGCKNVCCQTCCIYDPQFNRCHCDGDPVYGDGVKQLRWCVECEEIPGRLKPCVRCKTLFCHDCEYQSRETEKYGLLCQWCYYDKFEYDGGDPMKNRPNPYRYYFPPYMSDWPPEHVVQWDTEQREEDCCDYCKKKQDEQLTLKKCSRCKIAKYCSKTCQKKSWKRHKPKCQPIVQS